MIKNALFKPSYDVLECKFCLGNYTLMPGYNWQESMKHTVYYVSLGPMAFFIW